MKHLFKYWISRLKTFIVHHRSLLHLLIVIFAEYIYNELSCEGLLDAPPILYLQGAQTFCSTVKKSGTM